MKTYQVAEYSDGIGAINIETTDASSAAKEWAEHMYESVGEFDVQECFILSQDGLWARYAIMVDDNPHFTACASP